MGIAGTEVAKEASDIILMDDNFASLVKAVVWGRCVYDAIRKFLQFQLTVNISAVVITVVTALHTTITGNKKPVSALTAIQLLWVNLIMDTLAALALATDEPSDQLLNRKPSKRTEPIINPAMFKQIIGQAIYQIVACLIVYFMGQTWFPDNRTNLKQPPFGYVTATMVFNVFIFCQVFNEINCRSISRGKLFLISDKNVFSGFFNNYIFISIFIITVLGQIVIVTWGGIIFSLDPEGLSLQNWGISLAIGFGSLIVGFLIRLLPDFNIPIWLLGGAESPAPLQNAGQSTLALTKETTDDAINLDEEPTAPATPTAKRWAKAINATKMQIRVVETVKDGQYRPRRMPSTLLANPRAVMRAKAEMAKLRSRK
jgi:Ca2+-transporting ATPase